MINTDIIKDFINNSIAEYGIQPDYMSITISLQSNSADLYLAKSGSPLKYSKSVKINTEFNSTRGGGSSAQTICRANSD